MEKIDQYKQSKLQFIIQELVIFLSQVVIFLLVSIFVSNFLKDENALVTFIDQQVNNNTLNVLLFTLLAITVVIGIFTTVGRVVNSKKIERFIDQILYEIPKTIYFFGASISGSMLGAFFYLLKSPDSSEITAVQFLPSILIVVVSAFAYGAFFSYLFKQRTHIIIEIGKK